MELMPTQFLNVGPEDVQDLGKSAALRANKSASRQIKLVASASDYGKHVKLKSGMISILTQRKLNRNISVF